MNNRERTLTLEWLQAHDACREAVTEFRRMYPGGEAPLADVVAALAEHIDGADWLEWLLINHPVLEMYEEQYESAWLASWAQYLAAWPKTSAQIAKAQYEEAAATAWALHNANVRVAMQDIAKRL